MKGPCPLKPKFKKKIVLNLEFINTMRIALTSRLFFRAVI